MLVTPIQPDSPMWSTMLDLRQVNTVVSKRCKALEQASKRALITEASGDGADLSQQITFLFSQVKELQENQRVESKRFEVENNSLRTRLEEIETENRSIRDENMSLGTCVEDLEFTVLELQRGNKAILEKIQSLHARLTDYNSAVSELQRFARITTASHLRVLFDQARFKVVQLSQYQSWESLGGAMSSTEVRQYIERTHRLERNAVAQVATMADIRKLLSEDCTTLEQVFRFVYDEDVLDEDV